MFVENYVKLHKIKNAYASNQGENSFSNVEGWLDFAVGSSLIFSYRNNFYTKQTFTEGMHSHDYYELIIYLSGNVEYINETSWIKPSCPCAVWFKPHEMHTARLLSPCNYERVVLYFSKNFFEFENTITPIIDFTFNSNSFAITLNNASEIVELCKKAQSVLTSNLPHKILSAKTFITEIFMLLNSNECLANATPLTDDMYKIKNYIDSEYCSIECINQIAKRFYLSREHLSRQFKKRFNVNISTYVTSRRIAESIKLLKTLDVTSTAYAVGFNSMSAFISAFKSITGLTPSDYKKQKFYN